VKSGATYLSDAGTSSDIQTVQVRNPNGDLVVVIANKRKNGQNLQIDFKAAGPVSGYVPPRSVTTWILSSSETASQNEQSQVTQSIIV